MSSILKALKKLEDEKATRQPESLKIDSDILRVDNSQRYSATGIVLAALLLFAGGSIATYMYMKRDSTPVVDGSKETIEVSKVTQPSLQLPVASDIKTEKLPEVIEIVPAKRSESKKASAIPKQQKQTAVAKPLSGGTFQPNTQLKHDDMVKKQPLTVAQPSVAPKAVPALRVNGIAFQDGDADSVAVINGVPVSGGSMIEGAKVEAIHKDRVRFSYKGEIFDIALGKSNR